MNHRVLAALAAGLIATKAGPASAQTTPAPSWLQSVSPMGWEYLTSTDDKIWFVRPAVQPTSGMRRVWVRSEYANPENEGIFRSAGGILFVSGTVILQEVDCNEQKQRNLQITYYDKRNMTGETSSIIADKPSWSYSAPGTIGETWSKWACSGRVSDPVQPPAIRLRKKP